MQKASASLREGYSSAYTENNMTGVMFMKRKIYRVESILSGSNFYDEEGNHIGYSVLGIGGGEDYFFNDGETGYTVGSVINGQDYYGSDGTRVHSVDGLFGGQNIYGDVSGFSVDSPFGGSYIFVNGNEE